MTLDDIISYCNIYPDIRNKVLTFTNGIAFIKDNVPIKLNELLINQIKDKFIVTFNELK